MADRTRGSELTFRAQWHAFNKELWSRLANVSREALTQHITVLVASFVLLTMSAVCVRVAWHNWSAYYDAIKRHMQHSTEAGEPRSDIEYPSVVAAVLAPINGNPEHWKPEHLSATDGRRIDLLLTVGQRLMQFALDDASAGSRRSSGALEVGTAFQREVRRVVLDDTLATDSVWVAGVVRHLRSISDRVPPALVGALVPESSATHERVARRGPFVTGASPGRSTSIEASSLVIPSGLATDPFGVRPNSQAVQIQRAREATVAAEVSLLLEDAVDAVRRRFRGDPCTDSTRVKIVQAYFISDHDLLRIWPPRAEVGKELPTYHSWSSAHYFKQFYAPENANRTRIATPAYLDLGGNGVVRTVVQAVEGPTYSGRKGLYGVIAVDYQVPMDEYLEALAAENCLFDLMELRVPQDKELEEIGSTSPYRLRQAVHVPGRPKPLRGYWRTLHDETLRGHLINYGRSLARSAERMTMGRLFDDTSEQGDSLGAREFILPLADHVNSESVFLILRPRTPMIPEVVRVSSALAALLAAIALGLVFGYPQFRHKQLEERERATFLRNLPTGVLELDKHENIVCGNQASEWLLATTVHQFGEYKGQEYERRDLTDILNSWVVELAPEEGRTPADQPAAAVGRVRRLGGWLRKGRQSGASSTVLARVREDGKVIFLSIAPVIQGPSATLDLTYTCVLRPVQDSALAENAATLIQKAEFRDDGDYLPPHAGGS